jgi:hypothetical protein
VHPAGLEPAIPASKLPQTHDLDRTATGIDNFQQYAALYSIQMRIQFYFLNCYIVNSFIALEAGLQRDTIDISTKDCSYRLSRLRNDPH